MTAAAKAGLSVASARRIDLDPRPPSAKKQRRTWRTRSQFVNQRNKIILIATRALQ
jgi:hypothetical protein